MADKYLRHKPSGILYIWQEAYAFRDDFEEVVEVAPPVEDAVDSTPVVVKTRRTKKAEPPVPDEARIQEDASRDLP